MGCLTIIENAVIMGDQNKLEIAKLLNSDEAMRREVYDQYKSLVIFRSSTTMSSKSLNMVKSLFQNHGIWHDNY